VSGRIATRPWAGCRITTLGDRVEVENKGDLLKPGERYMVTVEMGSTSNPFAKGHRIRLDISSSNYPAMEPNPNTGEPAWSRMRRRKAVNTVWHDRAHATSVTLPVRTR